jgi:hypothetical protein
MTGYEWLASYPKSGSTWFRALLWALDHPAAAAVDLTDLPGLPVASSRDAFDEATGLDSAGLDPDTVDALRAAAARHALEDHTGPAPRLAKAHDAYAPGRFPADATRAAVYLVRDPLDVCVSYAHHQGGRDLDRVIDQMADPADALTGEGDRQYPQLRQPLGGWSRHVASWLDQQDFPVAVVRYEDLHRGDPAVVLPALGACGRAVGPTELAGALRRCRFAELARAERAGGFPERPGPADRFFRAGRVGDGRRQLSTAQAARLLDDHGEIMGRLGYAGGSPRTVPPSVNRA